MYSTPNSMNFYGGVESKYKGEAYWVQVIDIDMTGSGGYFDGSYDLNPSHTGVLDNQEPFGPTPTIFPNFAPTGNNNTIPLDDSPQASSYLGGIRFNITCTDYLMFQPDGGTWVPLGKTTTPWSVHCHASWPSLDILPDNHVTGPGDLNNSTDYPEWEHIFSNQ